MKKIYLIALSILAGAGIIRAQTNAPNTNAVAEILALVTTNAPPPKPTAPATTQIYSDSFDGDLNGRRAIYRGHVRVEDPRMTLTCAQITVDLSPTGGRINHVVAETNVVIDATDEKGATNHVTCGKAVYDYNVQGSVTNDTVTLTGNPQIVNAQGTNTADVIVWDRANGHIRETNEHMSGENLGGAGANTNGLPAPKLF
ncbi:MAG TPA: LptA/OstA family protein [Candidatus Paceibacterota bacterium]|nr:LptA/OstA family protein [Candidatus Paceibacterota bacterium]